MKKILMAGLLIIIISLTLVAGYYFLNRGQTNEPNETTPPETTPETTPSETTPPDTTPRELTGKLILCPEVEGRLKITYELLDSETGSVLEIKVKNIGSEEIRAEKTGYFLLKIDFIKTSGVVHQNNINTEFYIGKYAGIDSIAFLKPGEEAFIGVSTFDPTVSREDPIERFEIKVDYFA